MTRAMWVVKKNIARYKILALDKKWGGTKDEAWLKQYIDDITARPLPELDQVLEALDDLNRSNYYKDVPRGTKSMDETQQEIQGKLPERT